MCNDKHKVFSKEWWGDQLTEIKNVRGPKIWNLDEPGIKFEDIQPRDTIEFTLTNMPQIGGKYLDETLQQRVDKILDDTLIVHDIRNGKDFPDQKDRWTKKDVEEQSQFIQGVKNKRKTDLKESVLPDSERLEIIQKFVKFCKETLGIEEKFKIKLSKDLNHVKEIRSFGTFDPDSNHIWVYWGDGRNLADVCRTLGHELIHRRQAQDGRVENGSGDDGSKIENEANAKAGVLLRKFGRIDSRIYG